MGTSNWQNISYCCEVIFRLSPDKSLDIGIGSLGRWAMHIREFSDIWRGRVLSETWRSRIDGIEAFTKQIGGHQRCIYDRIYAGDAFEVIDLLGFYDLIVMGDVLEHFPEASAVPMIGKCLKRCRWLLVTTPLGAIDEWPQGDEYGNRWETHQVTFTAEFFLDAKDWKVIEYRIFRDFKDRQFGTFVLCALSAQSTEPRKP